MHQGGEVAIGLSAETDGGVVGNDTVGQVKGCAIPVDHAIGVVLDVAVADGGVNPAAGGGDRHPGPAVVVDPAVQDRERRATGRRDNIDTVKGEPLDRHIVQDQRLATLKEDASSVHAESLDLEMTEDNDVARSG